MWCLDSGFLVTLCIEIHQGIGDVKQWLVAVRLIDGHCIFDICLLMARVAGYHKIECLCVIQITPGNAQLSFIKCRLNTQIIHTIITDHQCLTHL